MAEAAGFEIKRLQRESPERTFEALYPHCRHKHGFVYDIFGHLMYQNVTDHVDYGGLKGESLDGYIRRESDETAFIIDRIKPGQVVVDIGANIGFYTLLLAKLAATGRVYAFEPGRLSFSLLTINTLLNGYENVELVNQGVTSSTGTAFYYSGGTVESGSTVALEQPVFDHTRHRVAVPTVALDDFFRDRHAKVDYIKIDIEGGEFEALKGMTQLLENNPQIWLTVEFAPYLPLWANVDIKEFLDFVRGLGFQLYDVSRQSDVPATDEYLLREYPKTRTGRYCNLMLERPK